VCVCEDVYWDYPGVFSPRLSLGDLLSPVERHTNPDDKGLANTGPLESLAFSIIRT